MPLGPRSRGLPVRTVRAPARPTAAARGAMPGARETRAVTLGPRAAGSPPRPCPGSARVRVVLFGKQTRKPTSLGDAPLPPPGRFVGKGLIGSPASSPEVDPGMARARGHRGPEAVTGPSARARRCCAQSLLACAPPARACFPGHNKVGREPQAVVRPAGGAPAARPEQARPGDHSRTGRNPRPGRAGEEPWKPRCSRSPFVCFVLGRCYF